MYLLPATTWWTMPRLSPVTSAPGHGTLTTDYNLAPLFAEETAKPTQTKLFHLVGLTLPSPESPLYLVDSNYDVKFAGQLYTRFPLKWSPAEMNSDGSISKSSITIANVSREIMYYVEQYKGLRTCRVSIKTVYENALDELYFPQSDGSVITEDNPKKNNTAFVEDEFYIDNYSATEQTVTFQLEPIIDLEIRLPRRRYMQDSCYFTYGDPSSCTRVPDAEFPSCGKTLAECKLRGNERNFGGFPGISGTRRVYL